MPTSNDRITDRPLSDPQQDDFRRADFAARLAETLLAPSHTASIVVGLYGKWGEGKSTVLNFIEHQLKADRSNPVILHLNPWRFPDEGQLLLDFFKQLTAALGQKLHNKGEQIADAVTKYVAPLLPTFSLGLGSTDPGKSLQAIGNFVQPSLDELHRRVDQAIVDSDKRVVVFIDDIDRLEKTQIQAVFRLVKLTANFRRTTYLLAFDDVMVARAIGEVFAPGADATSPDALSAGQNFLEKIVQVPLRLPRARQQDLWQYCRTRVQEALTDTQTELDDEQARRAGDTTNARRFDDILRRGILPRLTTPRLAIRYANAIRFSLPLLRGEANTVDLLLVEALNIFYPELHQFVAARQDQFAGDGQARQVIKLHDGSDEPDTNTQLDNILHAFNYTGDTVFAAKSLLTALFPRLTATTSPWPWADNDAPATEAELNRRQSVAAPAYFSRYFSYSVARGDVSDEEFNAFIRSSATQQSSYFRDFIHRLGVAITLQRIEYRLPDLTTEQSTALFNTISQNADLYEADRDEGMFGYGEVTQACKLLIQLLSKLPDESERMKLATQFIREGGNFNQAYEFEQQLYDRQEAETTTGSFGESSGVQPLFSPETWERLQSPNGNQRLLLERALREAGSEPIYRTHPEHALKLLAIIWPNQPDIAPGPIEYLFTFLDKQPTEIDAFLEISSQRNPRRDTKWAWLDFRLIKLLYDVFGKRLYDIARAQFGPQAATRAGINDFGPPTPQQRLEHFIWLFEKEGKKLEADSQDEQPG
jgi:predicted KAP-like P-loop ATPase